MPCVKPHLGVRFFGHNQIVRLLSGGRKPVNTIVIISGMRLSADAHRQVSQPIPRTRLAYDEPGFKGYEVVLDVWEEAFAYGILLVPKGIEPDERRPVVVCQHGLEADHRT